MSVEHRYLLVEAVGYMEHASWRCEYPPNYYLTDSSHIPEGDCACGLNLLMKKINEVIMDEDEERILIREHTNPARSIHSVWQVIELHPEGTHWIDHGMFTDHEDALDKKIELKRKQKKEKK